MLSVGMLAALVSGCGTATVTPTPTVAPAPTPTVAPTNVPTASPTSTPFSWPAGVTAHPADSGATLGYLEYLPANYDENGESVPLLVFLHGTPEGGDGSPTELPKVLLEGIPKMIADGTWPAELPFIVLAPQYSAFDANGHCTFGDDLDEFLGVVVRSYRVDRTRMYLTGISCGAIGLWDYFATTHDNVIAAAVPISGHPADAMAKAGCAVATTPTWSFHGALDDIIPVDRLTEQIDRLRACEEAPAGETKLTTYPDAAHGDNNPWDRTFDGSAGNDIYSWLLEHERQ